MSIIYVLIIFLATLIGLICGMGGGVIIKPLLDAISNFSSFQISLISSACVLAMSCASLLKHYFAKTNANIKSAIFLSIGSILGSLFGDYLLTLTKTSAINNFGDNGIYIVKVVQNALLFLLISTILVYMILIKKKGIHFNVKNPYAIIIVGISLGTISNYLDIGGPMNVCTFVFVLGMNVKSASVCSLITIFFTKTTKFINMGINGSFVNNTVWTNNFPVYIFILFIVCAVVGGIVGAKFNKKLKEDKVNIVYCSSLSFVAILCIYNIIVNSISLFN